MVWQFLGRGHVIDTVNVRLRLGCCWWWQQTCLVLLCNFFWSPLQNLSKSEHFLINCFLCNACLFTGLGLNYPAFFIFCLFPCPLWWCLKFSWLYSFKLSVGVHCLFFGDNWLILFTFRLSAYNYSEEGRRRLKNFI